MEGAPAQGRLGQAGTGAKDRWFGDKRRRGGGLAALCPVVAQIGGAVETLVKADGLGQSGCRTKEDAGAESD
jgi:hypothetical protein